VFAALKRQKPTLFLAPPLFYESACSLARDSGASSASADHGRAPRDSLSELFGGRMRRMYSGMAPIAPAILELYRSAGLPIFEAYGMTEYGPIAANGPDANVIGSVGRPLVSGSVALTDDGEIVVRSPRPLTIGYLGELTEAERLVYLDDAAIATGDIGHLDERGFLFIDGRKKQIIITSQGYKIHPESIERRFHGVPALLHVVVMGDGLAELGLLAIVERLEAGVRERVADIVSELNAGPCRLHPIRKVRLSSERFTVDNGLLTANLKLHRPNIIACYQDQVFGS
jgi:long-subunit acyl-CoA synthetase (AMP-forming)